MSRTTIALIVALVVSVAINLVILGTIIGHRAAHGGPPGPVVGERGQFPRGMTPLGPLDHAFRTVPEELRPRIRERLAGEREAVRAQVRAVRDARRAVADALSARPFDPAAAETALAELRRQNDAAQNRLHEAVIAAMAEAQAGGTLPPPRDRDGRPPDAERPRPD